MVGFENIRVCCFATNSYNICVSKQKSKIFNVSFQALVSILGAVFRTRKRISSQNRIKIQSSIKFFKINAPIFPYTVLTASSIPKKITAKNTAQPIERLIRLSFAPYFCKAF